jgi:hypothetical protein
MKNILFHSSEFWFNAKGFTDKPKEPPIMISIYADLAAMNLYEKQESAYGRALQLALADAVKFADQEAIRIAICELQPNKGPGYYQFEPIEGQTFFIEGVDIEIQGWGWKDLTGDLCWGKLDNPNFIGQSRKVAVLSNSPVKSETSAKETINDIEAAEALIADIYIDSANLEHIAKTGKINGTLLAELRRMLTKNNEAKNTEINRLTGNLEAYINAWQKCVEELKESRLQPKAEPTVEGVWLVKINTDGQFVLTNGDITLTDQEDRDGDELQSIAALLNRAPLGEETNDEIILSLAYKRATEIYPWPNDDGLDGSRNGFCRTAFMNGVRFTLLSRRSPDKSVGED